MEKSTVKLLANTTAYCVPLILIAPFVIRAIWDFDFTPEQYLAYSIGMASPLAALAGYLFVYLSFIQQTETSSFDKNERVFNQYLKIYQTCIENLEFSTLLKKGSIKGKPNRKKTTEKEKKHLINLLREFMSINNLIGQLRNH
jgi:hypothetical protein